MDLQTKLINLFYKFRYRNVPKPPYKHIVQLGDPVLRFKCKPVEKSHLQSPEFKKLLVNMRKAMRRYKCVGLSAPQLGVDLCVIAINFPDKDNYFGTYKEYEVKQMEPYPYSVWINPSMKVLDYSTVTFFEGCESMRGFSAEVSRYMRVQLSGWDENGEDKTQELSGWVARIAQHEMDHLDGQMYLEKARVPSLICSFWDRVNCTGGKIHMSYYPNKIFSKA